MRMVLIASLTLLAGLASGGATAAHDGQDRRGYGVSHSQAVAIARSYGVRQITELKREDDGGWEIEGRDRAGREIEIEIDRRGRVTDVERDHDDDRRGYGIGRGHALEIARRYGVWRVTEIKREDDGGWEIEGRDRAGREVEIEIDSRGRVTDFERD